MTTDVVIRYAENINSVNPIADFSKYAIKGDNISAVSWELPKCRRDKSGEYLLKEMVNKSFPNNFNKLLVMIELTSIQPDNAIVNYKKMWGLLKARGVNVDEIENKNNFAQKNENGLILSGGGIINLALNGVIESLINSGERIYFSILDSDEKNFEILKMTTPSDWMNSVWENSGIVFILLGALDESDCEVVALSEYKNLQSLIE